MEKELSDQLNRIESLLLGNCPFCGNFIKGWEFYDNLFIINIIRKKNIDPLTGHSKNCKRKDIKL